jgi:hypothetical protein
MLGTSEPGPLGFDVLPIFTNHRRALIRSAPRLKHPTPLSTLPHRVL